MAVNANAGYGASSLARSQWLATGVAQANSQKAPSKARPTPARLQRSAQSNAPIRLSVSHVPSGEMAAVTSACIVTAKGQQACPGEPGRPFPSHQNVCSSLPVRAVGCSLKTAHFQWADHQNRRAPAAVDGRVEEELKALAVPDSRARVQAGPSGWAVRRLKLRTFGMSSHTPQINGPQTPTSCSCRSSTT